MDFASIIHVCVRVILQEVTAVLRLVIVVIKKIEDFARKIIVNVSTATLDRHVLFIQLIPKLVSGIGCQI